ncbi:MAG TPA: Mth938-like domain-containing protein [Gammaproteobacteria bacterium]
MQLTRDTSDANVIHAWERGRVRVGETWIEGPLIVAADRIIAWDVAGPHALAAADLAPAIELEPEVILVGTGAELLLPDVGLMAELAAQGIGLEIMSTPAACRTYNVLVNERRRVVAALFNERR